MSDRSPLPSVGTRAAARRPEPSSPGRSGLSSSMPLPHPSRSSDGSLDDASGSPSRSPTEKRSASPQSKSTPLRSMPGQPTSPLGAGRSASHQTASPRGHKTLSKIQSKPPKLESPQQRTRFASPDSNEGSLSPLEVSDDEGGKSPPKGVLKKQLRLKRKYPLISALKDHMESGQRATHSSRPNPHHEEEDSPTSKSLGANLGTSDIAPRGASTPAEVRAELKAVFEQLDDDQSGTLSRKEFKRFFKLTPLGRYVSDTDSIFNEIELDGSGTIEIEEFLDYFDMIISKADFRGRGIGHGDLNVYTVIAAKIVDSIVGAKDHKNRFRRAFMQSVMELTSEVSNKNKLQATQWPYRIFDRINGSPISSGLSFLEHVTTLLKEMIEALTEPAERTKEELKAMRGGERRRDEAQRAKEYKETCADVYAVFFGVLGESEAPKPSVVGGFCAKWADNMTKIWAQARAEAKQGREAIAASAMKSRLQRWMRIAKTALGPMDATSFESDVPHSSFTLPAAVKTSPEFSHSPVPATTSGGGGRRSPVRVGGGGGGVSPLQGARASPIPGGEGKPPPMRKPPSDSWDGGAGEPLSRKARSLPGGDGRHSPQRQQKSPVAGSRGDATLSLPSLASRRA